MKDLFKNARELQSRIENLQDELRDELLKIAEENSPYKEGDEVTIDGYNHSGKKGIITRIGSASFSKWNKKEFVCELVGQVLKKDGTIGKNFFQFNLELGENNGK